MAEIKKQKYSIWLHHDIFCQADRMYKDDNCNSRSEFIEKAIIFYSGFLSAENNKKYLPSVIASTLKGMVDNSENHIIQMLFKMAVELDITMNVVAATNNVPRHDLQMLRDRCINDVKKTNGSFSFDDAWKFQNGEQ